MAALSIYNNTKCGAAQCLFIFLFFLSIVVGAFLLFGHFLFGVKYSNNKNYRDSFFCCCCCYCRLYRAFTNSGSNDGSRASHNHFLFYTNFVRCHIFFSLLFLYLSLSLLLHCTMFEIVLFGVCVCVCVCVSCTVGINFENVYIKYIALNTMATMVVVAVQG